MSSTPMPVFLAAGIGMGLGKFSTEKTLEKKSKYLSELTLFSAEAIVIG